MTFQQIFTTVKANLSRSTSTIDTEVVKWLNNRQRYICNLRNWWFMFNEDATAQSATDGVQSYNYPTGYKDNLLLYIVDSTTDAIKLMKCVALEDAYRYYSTKGDEDEPEVYVLTATQFMFFPIPDATYSYYRAYYKYATDATGLTDTLTNSLTVDMPDLLIAGTTADGFRYLQEYQDAEYWEKQFRMLLKDLEAMENMKKLPSRLRLVPMTDAKASTLKDKFGKSRVLKDYR